MAHESAAISSATKHVHHLNGNRADNRDENLELWTTAHPYVVRAT